MNRELPETGDRIELEYTDYDTDEAKQITGEVVHVGDDFEIKFGDRHGNERVATAKIEMDADDGRSILVHISDEDPVELEDYTCVVQVYGEDYTQEEVLGDNAAWSVV